MEEEQLEAIRAYLDRADEALQAARLLLYNGLIRDSVSKVYYAVFYAATSVLISIGKNPSKHSGVISLFGLELVKKGSIDAKYGRMLSTAFDDRNISDYRVSQEVSVETAETRIAEAEEFLSRMERYLREKDIYGKDDNSG